MVEGARLRLLPLALGALLLAPAGHADPGPAEFAQLPLEELGPLNLANLVPATPEGPAAAPLPPPTGVQAVPPVDPPQPPREWLRKREEGKVAEAPTDRTSVWILVGSLLAVGGAFAYKKRKAGVKVPGLPRLDAQIKVLSSGRVGPKAHAVVVEFAGQVLVLGVTDTNVTCLQALPKIDLEVAPTESSVGVPSIAPAGPARSAAYTADGRFRTLLDQQLADAPRSASAAERIAEGTIDRTSLGQNPRQKLLDVEGQAAGLAARLKRTFDG